jgi:hypothetical protein
MDTPALTVYRELADHYERLGQSSMRDRFLMLAADAAFSAGQTEEAERLRQRLLAGNRHHMLRPYGSFAEASRAADVQAYLDGLRANYPPEQAADLLNTLRGGDEGSSASPPTVPPPAAARPIPMTAPLLDLNAREPRPMDQPPPFQPMRVDAAAQRPRAQPAPAAQAASRPAPAPLAQTQPLREIPLQDTPTQQKREPRPPRPVPAPAARRMAVEPSPPPRRAGGGGWFNVALTVAAAAVAAALVGFALARPYLPSGWLP